MSSVLFRRTNGILPSLSLALSLSLASVAWAQGSIPDIVRRASPSIVVVKSFDASGRLLATGSGFFVSRQGDTVTNYHVIADAHSVRITTRSGKIYQAGGIVAADPVRDLVRLLVSGVEGDGLLFPGDTDGPRPYLKLSQSPPATGERVIVLGNPLGLERSVSDGLISAVREIPEVGPILQITAPISPGSSGSPVLNLKGEVVGVASFILKGGQNLNFAIPASSMNALRPGTLRKLGEAVSTKPGPEPAFQIYPDCRGWVVLGQGLETTQRDLIRQAFVGGLIEGRASDVASWGFPEGAIYDRAGLPRQAADRFGRGLLAIRHGPASLEKRLDVYCADEKNSRGTSPPSLGHLTVIAAFDLGGLEPGKVAAALQALRDVTAFMDTPENFTNATPEEVQKSFERRRRAFWDALTR